MQKHKSSKKFKTALLKSILVFGIFISPFAFAENPLVTQAKELQTGSEKVGIDHQKAIVLLKKAVDEGDAEAMYLLSQYYAGYSQFAYLPENPSINHELLMKSAKLGNLDAIDEIISSPEIAKEASQITSSPTVLQEFKPILQKEIRNKNIQAIHLMAKMMELQPTSSFTAICELYVQAYHLEKSLETLSHLVKCSDQNLQKFDMPERQTIFAEQDKMLREQAKDMLASKSLQIEERKALSYYLHTLNIEDEFQNFAKRLDKDIQNFYLKLGHQGYSDAYLMLQEENIISPNYLKWQDQAVRLNNRVALAEAGYAYLYGEMDRKKNQKLGLEYLEKSIQLNDANAMNTLAIWLINESENSQDHDKALKLLERAAQLKSTEAMKNLARISASPDNYMWAVRAYNNGANTDVAINEGILPLVLEAYKNGIGVKKDKAMVNKITQELTKYDAKE